MNKKTFLLPIHTSERSQAIGFTFLRISFGIIFIIFGYNKLMAGTPKLTQLGSAMTYFGIKWGHLWWGYLAALTELIGGLAYVTGFCTRLVSIPLIWLLIVAIKFHMQKGDDFTKWGFAFTCLCIVVSYLIAGSGKYSVDYTIEQSM